MPFTAAAAALLLFVQDGFPELDTQTLAGEEVSLPGDLPGPSLMLVGFDREHEDALLAWVEGMGLKTPGAPPWRQFTVLGERSGAVRWMIGNWMKMQIGEPDLREKTLMVYRDEDAMARALGLDGTSDVAVLAVTPQGDILARVSGPYDEDAAERLAAAIAEESG